MIAFAPSVGSPLVGVGYAEFKAGLPTVGCCVAEVGDEVLGHLGVSGEADWAGWD